MLTALTLIAGLVLLFLGGEGVVRGAVTAARRFGLSPFVIGVTVVGFGTSLPELVVSLDAALIGATGITVGNVVGSNIANMLLILGAAAVILPIAARPEAVRRDVAVGLAATLAFVAIAFYGVVTRPVGALMVVGLGVYLGFSLWADRRAGAAAALHVAESEERVALPERGWLVALYLVLGFAGLVGGAHLFVDGAAAIARGAGVPEEVIGLTLVALGTSLPELAASAMAAWRGHSDVALGNVLGSNLFNLLGILGVTAVVVELPISPKILAFDVWALLGATLLLIPVMLTGRRISRTEGAAMLGLYALFVGAQYVLPAGA